MASDETIGRVRPASLDEWTERTLTPGEVCAYCDAHITDQEREEVLSLVRWFRRRYPTPAERLAYVRNAYSRWLRACRANATNDPNGSNDPNEPNEPNDPNAS